MDVTFDVLLSQPTEPSVKKPKKLQDYYYKIRTISFNNHNLNFSVGSHVGATTTTQESATGCVTVYLIDRNHRYMYEYACCFID